MLIIDRFEGGYAVVEADKDFISIPRSELPKGAKEGDCLRLTIDGDGLAARKKRIDGLMNSVFKD